MLTLFEPQFSHVYNGDRVYTVQGDMPSVLPGTEELCL